MASKKPDLLTPGDNTDQGGSLFKALSKKPAPKKRKRKVKPNAKAPLGQAGRFAALSQNLAKKGAQNPNALAASIGRKKFGAARFSKLGH